MAQHGRHRAPGRHVRPKGLDVRALAAYAVVAVLVAAGFVVRPHSVSAHSATAAIDAKALAKTATSEAAILPRGITTSTVTQTTELKPAKKATLDADIAKGMEFIMNPGVAGKQRVTYQLVFVDGKQVARKVLASKVLKKATDAVVIRGIGDPKNVKVALASAARGTGDPAGNKNFAALYIQNTYGWGNDEFGCLSTLWTRESHWRHQARNRSSGAYGIAQALPGRKMSKAGSDWRTNPVTQIKWGASYIEGRYGSPCKALKHSYSHGWY